MMKIEEDIMLKKSESWMKLLDNLDLDNTLNGGRSEAITSIRKQDDQIQVKLRVPGVNVKNLKVEIKKDKVFVYYFKEVKNFQFQEMEIAPVTSRWFPITRDIDLRSINAFTKDDELIINLPFKWAGWQASGAK